MDFFLCDFPPRDCSTLLYTITQWHTTIRKLGSDQRYVGWVRLFVSMYRYCN